jgi:outer membrane receptor for ferrienterochelin and colicin
VGDNSGAVRLRGFSSFILNGDPLVVVDDVAVQGVPPLQVLANIPAGDVESIEVLRGPAAAFRYPYAANGVISVRTRKN